MKATTLAATVLAATGLGLAAPSSDAGVQVGVGVVIGGPAYGHGYPGPGADRYGFDRGYREGADNGFKDGRRGRRFEFWRDGDYRDADDGYKRWMGPRWAYAEAFRRGYEAGYRHGYREGCRERRDRDGRWYEHDRGGYDRGPFDRDGYGRDRDDDGRIYEIPREPR